MVIQTLTVNKDISISRESQKHLSDPLHRNVVMYQGKYRKWDRQKKWTENEYHTQHINDVSPTTPISPFFGLHVKSYGVRGLRKHYNLQLDPKLGHVNMWYKGYTFNVYHAPTCWTITGTLVYPKSNKRTINLFLTAHNGMC